LYSPLEQFGLSVILSYQVNIFGLIGYHHRFLSNIWLTIDNLVLYSLLIGIFIIMLLSIILVQVKLIPLLLQNVLELIYKFLNTTLIQQAGIEAIFFFPLIMGLFLFILFSNIAGLMNWSYTITAHLIITFSLAFSLNLGLFFYGIYKKRLDFFKIFSPEGVPMILKPLTTSIEIFSYLLRNFSLPIRLFANMLAGHILLAIISSSFFATSAIPTYSELPYILLILDLIIASAISILEIAVAFIQAYVFCVLLAVYLRDSLGSTH